MIFRTAVLLDPTLHWTLVRQETDIAVWVRSFVWAVVVMAAVLAAAVLGNIAVGRVIHWDVVAGLASLASRR